ncbi:RDD family protein [Nocardia sp. AG03]|uniref:RDD family protein n=1 Tax=Nocardia sp. AG03 TaxID=3025312 RepID=UPI0024181988|nr:RDD family protein [Nocardia sp. AG03]
MSDPGAERREAAALAKRYPRRADGTLSLKPELDADGQPVPSPKSLSTSRSDGSKPVPAIVAAVLIDWSLHILIGVGVWLALRPAGAGMAILYGLLAWIAASFVHRTVVQTLAGATLGTALFGLRLRHPDGRAPSLERLIARWFTTLLRTIGEVVSLP